MSNTDTKTSKQYLKQFFKYDHLPEKLQSVSRPFAELAEKLDDALPENPEKTAAFRKLLEAKDCAVRSIIFKTDESVDAAKKAA